MSTPKHTPGHTPGPWTVSVQDLSGQFKIYPASGKPAWDACNANARLIAAAPELLEALQLVLSDNRLMNAMNREQARAILDAVAKATGGAE